VSGLAEAFTHLIVGYDVPAPSGMLKVSRTNAAETVPGLPYSLLTNLHHTVVWQRFWLAKLKGGARKSGPEQWRLDWRVPPPEEWETLREEFLVGLEEARRIAASDPMDHCLPTDAEATDTLCRILVHASYHVGQMNVLKRAGRAQARSKADR
jgi:uncharacterized damage-inducible protein DinB